MGIRKISSCKYEKHLRLLSRIIIYFTIPVVREMLILSRLHLNDLNIPKDTTRANFIKYFNDKTVVFNNQIISGLLLLRTHGCKHCQTCGFSLAKSTGQAFSDFKLYAAVKLK